MIMAVIVIYLLVMLAIGAYASKKVQTDEDYLMGGFKLGIIPMTGTYLATFFSALSLLGGVGLIYRSGIGGSWMPMAWALGSAFGPILALRLRRVQMVSPSEFFYHRYGSQKLQVFGAGMSIISLMFNLVVQITAMGIVWNLATGRGVTEGLIIGIVVAIAYTVLGGFYAVVWTDVVQCVVFLGTIVIACVVVLLNTGGIAELYSSAATIDTAYEIGGVATEYGGMLTLLGPYTAISLFFNFLVQGPGTGTRPEYLQRIQAAKSMKVSLSTYKYAWIILIFVYIMLNIIGVGGRVLIPTMPDGMISDWIMPLIFIEYTSPIIAGLFFSSLLAAAMSTIDSSMMVITASATDILKIVKKGKTYTANQLMKFSRVITVLVGIGVFFMAYNSNSYITDIAGYSFGILGLTFFLPLIFGLYSKKANATSAWASIIGGGIAFVLWYYLLATGALAGSTVLSAIPAMGMGILVAIIVMIIAINFTKPMDEKYWKPFFEVGERE